MKLITRKSVIRIELEPCLKAYNESGLKACLNEFHQRILHNKVKFPLLEFCGITLFEHIPEDEHIAFCGQIEALKTEGGNVILGIILQKRLDKHFDQSIQKATEYISQADIWYVCDIIGERVFGNSLLHNPEKTLPEIKKLSQHPSHWVVRSLGAGAHYAIKKGLDKNHVKKVFQLLLSMANTNEKEIRQGVGWAAKTTAKFHPDIIKLYQDKIDNKEKVANWFRAKIVIGLNRNLYAKRNRS